MASTSSSSTVFHALAVIGRYSKLLVICRPHAKAGCGERRRVTHCFRSKLGAWCQDVNDRGHSLRQE